jgi:hypothetical protein
VFWFGTLQYKFPEQKIGNAKPCPRSEIAVERGIARKPRGAMDTIQAQTLLSNIGLLDPPVNGVFGPVTKWALGAFCASAIPFDRQHRDEVQQRGELR